MTFSAPRRPIVMLINKVALGPIVTHPRPKNSATIGCIAMTLTELKVRQAFCPPGARPMKCEPHLSAPDEVRRMKQDQENQAFSVWFGTIAAKTFRMGRIGLGIHIGGVRYRTLGRRRSL